MLGLADVYVPEAQLPALTEELTASSDGAATIVGRFAATPASAPLLAERATIDAVFGLDDVEEIVDALLAEGYGFASDTASAMLAKSPTSLKLTLRALREARELTHLEDALALEYRIMSRLAGGHDFFAGIRATVIDKDRLPNWSPATLAAVADADLDRYFTPLGADELSFVTEETVL
jgi:enoyl-CoA hydratase